MDNPRFPHFSMQRHQQEWAWQWDKFYDDSLWLFQEWIYPNTLETFRGKDALDCGCGGGQHLAFVAPYAREVWGIDLNASNIARRNTANFKNIQVLEGDIATMNLGRKFDIVYSIGVLHHTDNPTKSFNNIARHCMPNGRVIVWVYSFEGNMLQRMFIEPLKRWFIRHLPRTFARALAHLLTVFVYFPVYTLFLLPLPFLPYYHYFQNWRRLSYQRNLLNVFDKLNAPKTHFIKRGEIESWFNSQEFTDSHISHYKGVSYRASGAVKP